MVVGDAIICPPAIVAEKGSRNNKKQLPQRTEGAFSGGGGGSCQKTAFYLPCLDV